MKTQRESGIPIDMCNYLYFNRAKRVFSGHVMWGVVWMLLLSFWVGGSLLNAEDPRSDAELEHDLKMRLAENIKDSDTVHIFNELSRRYRRNEPDRALGFSLKAQAMAGEIGELDLLGVAFKNTATLYRNRGDYDQAFDLYAKALSILEKDRSEQTVVATILSGMGLVKKAQGNYEEALQFQFRALDIKTRINDKIGQAIIYGNIGVIYNDQGLFDKALEYLERAKEIHRELGDKKHLAIALNDIGTLYREMGQTERALSYLQEAVELREEIGDLRGLASSLYHMGEAYSDLGNFEWALDYHLRGVELRDELNDQRGLSMSYGNMAEINLKRKHAGTALGYSKRSLELAVEIGAQRQQLKAMKLISASHEALGEPEAALDYYKRYADLKEAIFESEKAYKVAALTGKYETVEKEREIALLKKEREVRQADLERREAELYQAEILRNAILGGLTLIVFLTLVLYNRGRLLGNANKDLLRAQGRLLAAQSNAHIGNWEILPDDEDRRKWWSDELRNIHGLKADDPLPENLNEFLELVHPNDCEIVQQYFSALFEGKNPGTLDYRIIRPDGQERYIHTVAEVEKDGEGKVARLYGTDHDVTELRQIERALQNSETQLRQSASEKERLARDLHDGIIQSIYAIGLRMQQQLIILKKNPDKADKEIRGIIQQLNQVIRDVRNFITGLEPEELKEKNLKTALENLIASLQKTRRCHFELVVDEESVKLLDRIQTVHLFHIAHELLSNSVRHADPKHVRCEAHREGESVHLKVINDGKSLAPDFHLSKGKGLRNIESRAEEMNASYKIVTDAEGLTIASVEVPVSCHVS